jgi:5'-nucleotidase
MRILLTNDDGILAPGIAALHRVVRDLGDVQVVAPDSAKSAAGHGITIRDPLRVRAVSVGRGADSFEGLSVSGSPADCVRLAISNLLDKMPDLVLSGMNAGGNVGNHVFYSGTVAAAAEAAMFNLPAVAMSASALVEPIEFDRAAQLCRAVLDRLLGLRLQGRDLINVNIPPLGKGDPAGIRVVRQSNTETRDVYTRTQQTEEYTEYRISDYAFAPEQGDSDVVLLEQGYITITPLHVDMTLHDEMPRLETVDFSGIVD